MPPPPDSHPDRDAVAEHFAAELDPAQLVHPPKGLEIGYVPIATRQELPPAKRK